MSLNEIIAVIFSLASVILTVKENKWCWPVGLVGIIFYAIIFHQQNLMGNFWLQSIFVGQSLLGIWNWNKSKKDFFLTWFDNKSLLITTTVLFYGVILLILEANFSHMVYLDSLTTTCSIFGMFLLAFKVIDGWFYWILADVAYVWIFYQSELYLSSGVYFIFLILSIIGLYKWNNMSEKRW